MDRARHEIPETRPIVLRRSGLAARAKMLDRLTESVAGRAFFKAYARGVSIRFLDATFGFNVYGYYWTMRQSEYATT